MKRDIESNATAALRAIVLAGVMVSGCGDGSGGGEPGPMIEASDADFERGPHNGRLLRDEDFALEITIFESGQPPQYRVYPFENDRPVDPSKVALEIRLDRLGGKVDTFKFKAERDYLAGDGIVVEPHSFDVIVEAAYDDRNFEWSYASYEGRTIIGAETAAEAGVRTEKTGPAVLRDTVSVLGRVEFAPGGTATLRARFPGKVMEVSKAAGERIETGDVLARVESNVSLQQYEIASPIDGVVLERYVNQFDITDEAPLFVIGDLNNLHADFRIFAKDLAKVKVGQKVIVSAVDGSHSAETEIERIVPSAEPQTQTMMAHAVLPNEEARWMPGMSLMAEIVVGNEEIPLAVRTKALQRFRDFEVVFARFDDTYEVRMLELGRRTPEWTEVLGGIDPGQEYVVENSFLIKADVEKSGASHDH